MSPTHADSLIEGYLARLNATAGDLPKSAREELVEDMRSHIAEARAREPQETDATILNILDRLGEPGMVAAETRERLGLRPSVPYRPGVLDVAAVILVPVVWPIGVILLWMSPAWHWRDKVIATLVPPGGYMGLAFLGVAFATVGHSSSGGTCVVVTQATGQAIQNGCQASQGPSAFASAASLAIVILFCLLPVLTAGYLAMRLSRQRQIASAMQPVNQ